MVGREWKRRRRRGTEPCRCPCKGSRQTPRLADTGQLAIQRGPLVYCLEACDQSRAACKPGLARGAELKAEKASDLLGGVVVVKGFAEKAPEHDWATPCIRQSPIDPGADHGDTVLRLGQSQAGPDEVWLPQSPRTPAPGGLETQAKVSMSFVSGNCQPWGINDGLEPKSSGEQPAALSLVAAPRSRRMGAVHLEEAGDAEERQGLLVRRHRPRRLPVARLVAGRVSRR